MQLLSKGLKKLHLFAEGDAGLALEDFRKEVELALKRAVEWKEGGPPLEPADYPRLRVRV